MWTSWTFQNECYTRLKKEKGEQFKFVQKREEETFVDVIPYNEGCRSKPRALVSIVMTLDFY